MAHHPFKDQVVVITGAGSGIGAITARMFADDGATVVIADINEDAGRSVAESLPGSLAIATDVAAAPSVRNLFREIDSRYGQVDVVINNAMSCTERAFLDLTPEDITRDISVSLIGALYMAQAAIPMMRRQRRGVILNVSSVNGLAFFGNEAYSAAKAGLISLTKSLANQFGPDGIRCAAVAPGTIATPYWEHRKAEDADVFDKAARWYPLGRVGRPEDVAHALRFLASEHASWISGVTLPVDGGLLSGNTQMARDIVPREREGWQDPAQDVGDGDA